MEETLPVSASYWLAGIFYGTVGLVVFLAMRSRRNRVKYAESLFSESRSNSRSLPSPVQPPQARSGLRWFDWVLAFMTAGLSLLYSFPASRRRRGEQQKKLDAAWRDYLHWLGRKDEPFFGFSELFRGESVVSSPEGVYLEEARQGDTTTITTGDISLRGGTGTVGVGVGVGPVGFGVASSQTSLSGSLNSEGKSTVGKDVAREIDRGQLIAGQGRLNFIGNLQTRDIPFDDILSVRRNFHVVLVSARSLPVTQRFRFRDRFAAQVFEHALSAYLETQEFPTTKAITEAMHPAAEDFVLKTVQNLEKKMQKIVAET